MNRKTIIEVVITICAFIASGLVLYNGLKKPPVPIHDANIPSVVSTGKITDLLPYGTTLDFSVLDKQGFYYNAVHYETVNTSTEVGINPDTLIVPR